MIYFSLNTNNHIRNITIQSNTIRTINFQDGEFTIEYPIEIIDKEITIITSYPFDESVFLKLLMAVKMAKSKGAIIINIIIPYLGYSRETGPSSAQTGKLIIESLINQGANKITLIDPHDYFYGECFYDQINIIDHYQIFIDHLLRLDINTYTLVSPDIGSMKRVVPYLNNTQSDGIAFLKKRDIKRSIIDTSYYILRQRNMLKKAIIIDDIIDSGGTILRTAEQLRDLGYQNIIVVATHLINNDLKFLNTDLIDLIITSNSTSQEFDYKKIYQVDISTNLIETNIQSL